MRAKFKTNSADLSLTQPLGFFLRKSVMRDQVLSRSTTRRSDLPPPQSSDNQRPPSGRLFSNSSSSSSDAAAPRRSPGPTGVSSLVDERLLAFLMKQHADAAAAGLMPPLAGLPTSMAPSGEPREAGEAHCATSAASGLPLGVLSTLVSCVLLSTVACKAELVHSLCAQLQVRSPVGRDLCSMINLGAVEVSPFPPLSPSFLLHSIPRTICSLSSCHKFAFVFEFCAGWMETVETFSFNGATWDASEVLIQLITTCAFYDHHMKHSTSGDDVKAIRSL